MWFARAKMVSQLSCQSGILMERCTTKERGLLHRFRETTKEGKLNYKKKSTSRKSNSVRIKKENRVIANHLRKINNKKKSSKIN
jgi:hypothetical protein